VIERVFEFLLGLSWWLFESGYGPKRLSVGRVLIAVLKS
jgi:hypothetical protein